MDSPGSLKRCPFCAEAIQGAAVVCRFCGRDLPRQAPVETTPLPTLDSETARAQRTLARLGWITVLVLVVFAWSLWAHWSRSQPESPTAIPSAISASTLRRVTDAIEASRRGGVITNLDVQGHTVHIKAFTWTLWDAQAKEGFAASVAVYCAAHTSGLEYADVIDSQSGKKLAHYGPFGFEVF